MDYQDLKRYNGYLPIRLEHQNIFDTLEHLIPGYTDDLFRAKWTGLFNIKIFKGEKQLARLREKEKNNYRYIPLKIWLNLSEERKEYSSDTWQWINEQKSKYSKTNKTINRVVSKRSILDL